MHLQLTSHTIPLFLSFSILLIVSWYYWQFRQIKEVQFFSLLTSAMAVWTFGYLWELGSISISQKMFWARFQYFGIVSVPFFFLLFSTYFTKLYTRLFTSNVKFILSLLPITTLIMVWTNQWHHLIWATNAVIQVDGVNYLLLEHGPWFWVNLGVSYSYILAGSFILIRFLRNSPRLYRGQRVFILMSLLIPLIANLVYVLKKPPIPHLDLTPFTFTIACIALALGFFRFPSAVRPFTSDIIRDLLTDLLVENSNDGILVLDAEDIILDLNHMMCHMINISKQDVIGRPFSALQISVPELQNIASINQPIEITLSEQITYEIHVKPLVTLGKVNGRLLTFHNISEHVDHEEILQKAKTIVENAQKKAETALKQARFATEAKNNFLNVMSHEIRTPLSAVVGSSNLLRDTPLNAEQQELVGSIGTNSDALLEVINNILEFAKIESGDLQLNNQPFDLQDSLHKMISHFTATAHEKSLTIEWTIEKGLPNFFIGDVVRLRQILSNLISNAIKFTEKGGVVVTVNGEQQADNLVELQFAITDTGIGISDTYITNLFKPFNQEDYSLNREQGGIGLGLAISQKLSKLLGGTLWAESKIDQGSTFYFTVVYEKSSQSPVRYLQPSKPSLRAKRLLIIARNAEARRIISREARAAGMTIYVASSTPEANYWLNSKTFDGLLIDNNLLNHAEELFIPIIKETHPHTPLILYLGANTDNQPIDTKPFAGFIKDPITTTGLYETLVNILSTTTNAKARQTITANGLSEMASRHPLRVLMVEDNLINQKVIAGLLKRLGYHVEIAQNGQEGVDRLSKEEFDVILMDIQMPVMNGLEATKLIRQDVKKQPHIIAVTANAMEGDREHYLGVGMDDYISKPVKLNVLVDALYRCQPINGRNYENSKSTL